MIAVVPFSTKILTHSKSCFQRLNTIMPFVIGMFYHGSLPEKIQKKNYLKKVRKTYDFFPNNFFRFNEIKINHNLALSQIKFLEMY